MSVRGGFNECDLKRVWFKRVCIAVFVQITFGREGRIMIGVVISNIDCTSSTRTMNGIGGGSTSMDKECMQSSKKLALSRPSQREHPIPS